MIFLDNTEGRRQVIERSSRHLRRSSVAHERVHSRVQRISHRVRPRSERCRFQVNRLLQNWPRYRRLVDTGGNPVVLGGCARGLCEDGSHEITTQTFQRRIGPDDAQNCIHVR